jgi:radical SAM protein with 4Fe4S-binding SPASM domain
MWYPEKRVLMKIDADSHKLIYHPDRVHEWRVREDCFPIYVEVGVTNRCNHRCIFCALDWLKRQPVSIETSVLLPAICDMAEHGIKSIMFAGEGEPLLHPDIARFVACSRNAGIDVAVATNGVHFTSKRAIEMLPYLSWIRFSVDAGTPQTYSRIHRGGSNDFSKVIRNISDAVLIKREQNLPVIIGVQLLLIPDTIHDVISFIETFKNIGVDNVQLKPYSQHPLSINQFTVDSSELKNLSEKSIGYQEPGFQVIFRAGTIERLKSERPYSRCHGLPFYALIEADGSIIPCNLYHANREYTYGNINTHTFGEIWTGKQRREVLSALHNQGIGDCRYGCRLDAVNRYLEALQNPHPHVNFI